MVGLRGEPVILILVAAIDLQQITATDISRHFLLRRSMQFKAVLIGFRHGLYGIISISAAITIIIAIIITICIVIAVSIAVVITIAVTIDIVIVFSAVLFNVFLKILSLTLTCLPAPDLSFSRPAFHFPFPDQQFSRSRPLHWVSGRADKAHDRSR